MKHLWAPWRMDYILERREEGCLFCRKVTERRDRGNLILYRGSYSFVMMNRFPYNSGHLMVVPYRHCLDVEPLRRKERAELFDLLDVATRVLREILHAQGFNVGINIGKEGGAGEDHLHIHVVPRWAGDTNFMPILGETKVIPQYLEKTCQTLRLGFSGLLKKRVKRKGWKQR
jgi:ATP adenylyltransferase